MPGIENVVDHFTRRAPNYDVSSRWCTDEALARRLEELLRPQQSDVVLDVACGTGLVAKALRPHVARIVGLDVTPEMLSRAQPFLDESVLDDAEAMPFGNDSFDVAICRQGIQFLDAARAVAEMVRVTRPGGKVCLINLCAYGAEDRDEFFEILRCRNPVRRNFFLREDLGRLLSDAGCCNIALHEHISVEDINVWSDRAAISREDSERIRELYRNASPAFRKLHRVEVEPSGRIRDHMLFVIAIGAVPP